MSSNQGFFESDDDYQERVAREANERTIEDSTGSAPSKGIFESDDDYRDRIVQEANEYRIEDSTGSTPSKRFLESNDDYQERIAREANEHTIEDSTGSVPSKGIFESDDDYDIRIRKEANEQIIESDTSSTSKQGWLEGDHDYRSRIAHEAREIRARDRSDSLAGTSCDSSYSTSGSSIGSGGGVKGLSPYYQEEFQKILESGEAYKGKWNWAAFFFSAWWALTKGAWLSAVICFGVAICTFGLSGPLAGLVYGFIFGFRGNYIFYTLHTKKKQLPL